jgi:predicted PurR-regulated permease PerM
MNPPDPNNPAPHPIADRTVETTSAYQPQWDIWTRRVIVILLILAAIWVMSLLAPVIQTLALALMFAFLMFAPSRALARNTPIPYGLSVVLLYLLLIMFILFLLLVFIPSFVSGVNSLIDIVERAYADFQVTLQDYQPEQGVFQILGFNVDLNFIFEPLRSVLLGQQVEPVLFVDPALQNAATGLLTSTPTPGVPTPGTALPTATPTPGVTPTATAQALASATPGPLATGTLAAGTPAATATDTPNILSGIDLRELLGSLFNVAGTVTGTLTTAIGSVTGLILTLLLAMFISFLLLLDLPQAQDAFMNYIPRVYHREYALLIARIVRVWNGFFRGQVLIGFIIGVLTWLELSILGVAGAEILAVFTGLISLIPTVGGIIALIPLGLVPLIQGSSVFPNMSNGLFALLVIGISLVINQVMWSVVAPAILGDALDLPLALIIIGVFIGTAVGGILGAFLVAPIMASARVLLQYTFAKLSGVDPFPGEDIPNALSEGLFTYVRRKSSLKPRT